MNLELMLEVRRRVLTEPQSVDMRHFHRRFDCGTSGCIAGHTILATGKEPLPFDETDAKAMALLDLSEEEAHNLFFFHQEPYGPYSSLFWKLQEQSWGTVEYAMVVVEAIDQCIARNHKPTPTITAEQTITLIEAPDNAPVTV